MGRVVIPRRRVGSSRLGPLCRMELLPRRTVRSGCDERMARITTTESLLIQCTPLKTCDDNDDVLSFLFLHFFLGWASRSFHLIG